MSYENFNIDKANDLSLIYKKKRLYAKARFVDALISYQHFFGNLSIVGAALSTPINFQKGTVESVLNDLDYKLVSFNHHKSYDIYGVSYIISTDFSFTKR